MPSDKAAKSNTRRYRVLIVEDSATMRELLVFCLRGLSQLDFDEVENGQQAIEKIEQDKIDLILLDLNMPVMNGFEFLERLVADYGAKAPPVVVVTTKGDLESIVRSEAAGARAYVTKPLESAEIVDTVKAVLGIG